MTGGKPASGYRQGGAIPRVLNVSNRLPVTLTTSDGPAMLTPSAGGLATGLRPIHDESDGLWIGWAGYAACDRPGRAGDAERVLRDARLVPVDLSAEEVHKYYDGFANGVMWPLFHYLLERVPLDSDEWRAYEGSIGSSRTLCSRSRPPRT
jgi:trehalose 6-phosphate synthase/phosphatase